ncbi:cytochrome ubiquinol oxidase subunit I [Allorhizocola rhizosphaerae]|uniref:cytochrome ubiquinol oxidase subunit I n=1 Tax=Allorhizocola rhizosphaerae TaxID=1872709 RepID=UPI000E3BD6B4|nr:cytochrome ubiquinol oxidase subunit I [Allorhizocola rhizosphaerae]
MDATELARWQFGITTVYHFLFVPLTIGMAFMVAAFQTAWVRTGDEKWLRLTKFYGKLFLINFAMGVVTGIVQEFQFGMNWSTYSRFVGDIFGAPLAIEALLAFFLESTFLGLWIFGWDRLPKRVHLACLWIAAVGTVLSAFFILAANSWMQNPVGFRYNPDKGRAELTDFWAVLTNKVNLITVPHTVAGAFLAAGGLVTAVALWHLRRQSADTAAYRSALKVGAWTTLAAMGALLFTGDIQGKIMTQVQPMKMAAAEGLYETQSPAPFSVLTIGTLDGSRPVYQIEIPGLLSWLGTGDWDGTVHGINDLRAEYVAKYGEGSYTPIIPVTYWTFRLMIGFGAAAALIALWALWAMRRDRYGPWLARAALALPLLPLAANTTGWVFTEMGRQPWIVFGQMLTAEAASPSVAAADVATSLAVFSVLYGVLAVVEVGLLVRFARAGTPEIKEPQQPEQLAFAY